MVRTTQRIELVEYQPQCLERGAIPNAIGKVIHQQYGKYVEIDPPTFTNNDQWKLRPKGYVGVIPVTADYVISIQPKTTMASIWQMLDWVGELGSFKIFPQLVDADAIEDLCDLLAQTLMKQIFLRHRRGLYRGYIPHHDRLQRLRGRIDWRRSVRQPWQTSFDCDYDLQTADGVDNQILLWTVHHLGRNHQLFQPSTQQQLRAAHRLLQHTVTLQSFTGQDCRDRLYHRLNQDYEPMHQLCGFFLEHLTPQRATGDRQALPFLIDTAVLYEKFVYAWLSHYLKQEQGDRYYLRSQEHYGLGERINYRIDLVLYRRRDHQAIAVLDTKYKIPNQPSNMDINQIIAYATFKQVKQAILIYPETLPYAINLTTESGIHISSLTFGLGEDSERHGRELIEVITWG